MYLEHLACSVLGHAPDRNRDDGNFNGKIPIMILISHMVSFMWHIIYKYYIMGNQNWILNIIYF